MSFQDIVNTATANYFPDLQIKYKDQSTFMKILGKILFFNPDFMTQYITTIGSTVYFPSASFITLHPVTSEMLLMHELVHIYDQKRVSKPIFEISYMLPQALFPICLLLMFLVSWKIMLPIAFLMLAPIPAYFRMYWERRAYFASLYVLQLLSNKLLFVYNAQTQANFFIEDFKDGDYYWMWPFKSIDSQFATAATQIASGKTPFVDTALFTMLQALVAKA